MDCAAIPVPAGQQRGGQAAEEQGSVLPAGQSWRVAGSLWQLLVPTTELLQRPLPLWRVG